MARGIVPRQPAKGGRQAGVKRAIPRGAPAQARSFKSGKNPLQLKSAAGRAAATKPQKQSGQKKSGYNPVAPERVQEILKRLDQTYPGVTCALNHKSAWELLV